MKDTFRYGKNVLITGGTSGIGRECCQHFADRGYHVWAASRSAGGKSEQLGQGWIHPLKLDVTNQQSSENAVKELYSQAGEVGIVIHCAGIGIGGASEDTPLEAVRRQFDTNYFGILRLNSLLLPHMRKTGRGLILIISSIAGQVTIPYQGHYSSSKYAIEAYAEALRMELHQFGGIKVALIEPGDTKTGFTGNRWKTVEESSPYYRQCQHAVKVMEHDEKNGKSPATCAKVALRLAQKKNPKLRTVVGLDYKLLVLLKKLLPASLVSFVIRQMYLK